MKRLIICVMLIILAFAMFNATAIAQEEVTLTIQWAAGAPMDTLMILAEDFTAQTGIKVVGDAVPWALYHDKMFTDLASGRPGFDIVLPDSQWLGAAVEGGHLVDLTDWVNENVDKNLIFEEMLRAYSEYPDGSGRYYGIPGSANALGISYRKDLFEDPAEQAAFKEKYGYPLDVPQTWSQLRDIAEFFYRPEQNLYGIALWQRPTATAGVVDQFLSLFWAFGAELWNPETRRVKGYLNSEEGKAAARLWVELFQFHPPGAAGYSVDDTNVAMRKGMVAMMGTYFSFYPGIHNPDLSLYWDRIGWFPTPGEKRRVSQLGGQGMSISAYTPHKEEALKFLEWWLREETQWKWVRAGFFSPRVDIIEDDRFLEYAPPNEAVRASFPVLKDFWEIPLYHEMGTVMAEILNKAVLGQLTPEEAMDLVAERHEEILQREGYYN
ncbi:MAG TPA: sugar ABC transporter substrate-binding protein [Atribacteraceae bacterium]|nr:sugar ABC transporter substrate-binding protein [Atribacteraceae bacterium]